MKDICCIGHITRDKIITSQRTVYMAGGTSFYMSHGISHLPGKVSYQLVTKVGADCQAEVEKLRARGVDVICHDSRHTVYFENKYCTDTNHRTQRVLEKADPFTLAELQPLEARIFHLGSLLNDDFSPELARYLSTKGRISIDAQGYLRKVKGTNVVATDWEDKQEILSYTDILKLNEHEMEIIARSRDPRMVARTLAADGVKEVVITLGSYGSLIYADGRFHEIPAYRPRKVVDTTGCGDTYSTGYLYCRMQGMNYEASGKFAAAMCTLKLEHNGPFDGDIEDVDTLITNHIGEESYLWVS